MKTTKEKGFTLVELLAIVIIISLLAVFIVPKVSQTLNNSKESIHKSSVTGLARVAENYYVEQKMKGSFQECYYDFGTDTNTCTGLEFAGDKPDQGRITIDKDGDSLIEVRIDNKCYLKGYTSTNVIEQEYNSETCNVTFNGKYVKAAPTDTHKGIVYLDPTNLETKCNESHYNDAVGTKSGCMKFYIFKENVDGTVDMIASHNTTGGVKWTLEQDNGSVKNYNGPREALYQLYEDTKDWTAVIPMTSDNNYTQSWTLSNTAHTFTIDYTKHLTRSGEPGSYTYTRVDGAHQARFITAEEIATITRMNTSANPNNWTPYTSSDRFYFGPLDDIDYSEQTDEQKARQKSYNWLYNNLNSCVEYGCEKEENIRNQNWSYWTSTASTDKNFGAVRVDRTGSINDHTIHTENDGIRPVVTILKTTIGM